MTETYILQNLIAFAETGTLVAASEKLNISQPALTRSFKKLEDDLGISLFNRTKNTITLNKTGLLAVKYARQILALQNEMEKNLKEYFSRTKEIKIASIAPAPLLYITDLIHKSFPEAKVISEIYDDNETLYELLKKDKVQLILTTQLIANERFYSEDFFEEDLKVVLPKTHPLAKRESVKASELAGETFIVFSELGFWEKLTKRIIPNAKFITQTERSDLDTIINNSTLLAFRTNYTESLAERDQNIYADRVIVPLSDKEFNVVFYATCHIEWMKQMKEIIE